MNIDKFKHQHLDMLRIIDLLRQLTHAGVERNAAEIAQRWGPPRAVIEFKPGHRVWHYYAPRDGLSRLSALPMTDLLTTERGRAAKEAVLLFDRDGILRQLLLRDLPFPGAQGSGQEPASLPPASALGR